MGHDVDNRYDAGDATARIKQNCLVASTYAPMAPRTLDTIHVTRMVSPTYRESDRITKQSFGQSAKAKMGHLQHGVPAPAKGE